jgi:hypothetical protein
LTCLYSGAPQNNTGAKISCIQLKKKDLLHNDTFILPDLVNMASLCSGVGSDLMAPFKLPGWKKHWKFEKIAWKTKKWYPKNLNSHPIWNAMPSHVILWNFIVFLRLTQHSAMIFTKVCLFNANTGKMTSMCAQGFFVQRLYYIIDTLR